MISSYLSDLLSLFFKISMGIPVMSSWYYLLWFVLKISEILTVSTNIMNIGKGIESFSSSSSLWC